MQKTKKKQRSEDRLLGKKERRAAGHYRYAARYLLARSAIMISVQQSFIRTFMRG
jgi:hypothetical protein